MFFQMAEQDRERIFTIMDKQHLTSQAQIDELNASLGRAENHLHTEISNLRDTVNRILGMRITDKRLILNQE